MSLLQKVPIKELFSEDVYRLLFATIDELPKRTREVLQTLNNLVHYSIR